MERNAQRMTALVWLIGTLTPVFKTITGLRKDNVVVTRLGNRGMLFEYNRNNRMRSLGLGTGVFVMTSIPVLNFLAMPVAVCAATKMTTRISAQQQQ
jgi:hypothetical protein